MALIKILNRGDELVFDLSKLAEGGRKTISVALSEKTGQSAVMVIRADRSITIGHIREQRIHND